MELFYNYSDGVAILRIIVETTFQYLKDLRALPELDFEVDLEAVQRKMLDHLYGRSVTFTPLEKEFIHKVFYAGVDWVQNVARNNPQIKVAYRKNLGQRITGFKLYDTQMKYLESIIK